MKYITSSLSLFLKTIMVVSSVCVLGVSVLQIISRFVTQLSIGWSTDILRLSFIYAVFSGMAYCAKENEHINLDIFTSMLPIFIRQIVETVLMLVVSIFCALLAYLGIKYSVSGFVQSAPFIRVPMSIYYMAIPVSMGLMAMYYFYHVINSLSTIISIIKNGETKQ